MLPTYEAVLQPNGQLQFLEPLKGIGTTACRVLVTVMEPLVKTSTITTPDWKQFAGVLQASPHLNDDPVLIQQSLRHKWD